MEVIGEDLDRTGSGLVERPGFQRLVGRLCAGQVQVRDRSRTLSNLDFNHPRLADAILLALPQRGLRHQMRGLRLSRQRPDQPRSYQRNHPEKYKSRPKRVVIDQPPG